MTEGYWRRRDRCRIQDRHGRPCERLKGHLGGCDWLRSYADLMDRPIYVASSWRNAYHSGVVSTLMEAQFEVYDFKRPTPRA